MDIPCPPEAVNAVTDPTDPDTLPRDHTQAILETTKRVASLLKESGVPFALAGSVAAFAHGVPARFRHDTDFCLMRQDADAAVKALAAGGITPVDAPEDWLLKARDGEEEIDLILDTAGRPVDEDLLQRAELRAVDSVRMPVLAPTDLMDSRLNALCEHYCDFADLLPMARMLRERIDWAHLDRRYRNRPLPDSFLYLLERMQVIEPREEARRDPAPQRDDA
ncbi:hypothetical protein [Streptomyces sp. NPDC089799]|uniref:nucleotidyltransferase family protein n=1 Tax=Streptomyces sp. NPDC089799 TaxID=3155066 RepID=UPI00342968B5